MSQSSLCWPRPNKKKNGGIIQKIWLSPLNRLRHDEINNTATTRCSSLACWRRCNGMLNGLLAVDNQC